LYLCTHCHCERTLLIHTVLYKPNLRDIFERHIETLCEWRDLNIFREDRTTPSAPFVPLLCPSKNLKMRHCRVHIVEQKARSSFFTFHEIICSVSITLDRSWYASKDAQTISHFTLGKRRQKKVIWYLSHSPLKMWTSLYVLFRRTVKWNKI